MTPRNQGFNTQHFELLKKYGLIVEIVSTQRGEIILQFNLPGGHIAGVAGPASTFTSDKFSAATAHLSDVERLEFFQSDASCYAAARALKAFAIQQKALQAAAENTKLNGDGKADLAVEATSTALTAVATQYAELQRLAAALDATEKKLFAVPAPDAADAFIDGMLLQRFAALSESEQIQRAMEFDKPEWERVLVALCRDPWPRNGVVADQIKTVWAKRVALRNEEAVIEYTIERQNNEFALRLSKFLADILKNDSLNGSNGRLSEFDYYKMVRETGGAAVIDIDPGYAQMYERRILEAAA